MSFLREHQMWIKHQNLFVDFDPPEFYHPLQYINNWLVVWDQLWVKFICHILSGFIPNWDWIHRCLWYFPTFPKLVLRICFNILYQFMQVLGWSQRPHYDTIQKCHQLHPCTQVDIRVSQQTRFQPEVLIHLFDDFLSFILNCKDVINVNKYVLLVLDSVALSCPWYHPYIRVVKT